MILSAMGACAGFLRRSRLRAALLLVCACTGALAGPPAEHRSELDRLLREYAADPTEHWWYPRDIGYHLYHLGRYAEAIRELEKARALFAQRKPQENAAYFLYWLGQAYAQVDRNADAVTVFRSILSKPGPNVDRIAVQQRLLQSLLELGDQELTASNSRRAREFYAEAARLQTRAEGSILEGDVGVRLYALSKSVGGRSLVRLQGTVIFCSVKDRAVDTHHRARAKRALFVFASFLRAASNGRVLVEFDLTEETCRIERVLQRADGVTFPAIEGSSAEGLFRRLVGRTVERSHFYVISHAGFTGSHGSAAFHYRFPAGAGRAPGRPRIDWNGTSAQALVHEFHHVISAVYYPALGEAHRFRTPAPAGGPASIAPCRTKEEACLKFRPAWIRGNSEVDYFVSLYENMDRLGGWTRLDSVGRIFAEQLGERVSSEWE